MSENRQSGFAIDTNSSRLQWGTVPHQDPTKSSAISLPEPRKLALEAFGVSPPYGAPRGPELAPTARGVGMGPRLNAPSAQFTFFDVHAHSDTPQTGPSAL